MENILSDIMRNQEPLDGHLSGPGFTTLFPFLHFVDVRKTLPGQNAHELDRDSIILISECTVHMETVLSFYVT